MILFFSSGTSKSGWPSSSLQRGPFRAMMTFNEKLNCCVYRRLNIYSKLDPVHWMDLETGGNIFSTAKHLVIACFEPLLPEPPWARVWRRSSVTWNFRATVLTFVSELCLTYSQEVSDWPSICYQLENLNLVGLWEFYVYVKDFKWAMEVSANWVEEHPAKPKLKWGVARVVNPRSFAFAFG